MAGRTRRFFSRLGAILEGARRFTLNAVFLVILLVFIVAIFSGRPEVPPRAALVLDPTGVVVDQLTGVDPITRLAQGELRETLLSDMIRAVDRASRDARIPMLVIALNDLDHIGISKSLELAEAIKRFRESGKPVVAVADSFDQDRYFLGMHANEIYLSPMGAVAIEGFGLYRNYFKRALDKLAVNFHVFKVGEFKSATEPFTRNSMSEEDRRASIAWLQQLWGIYKERVQTTRGIKPDDFDHYVNHIDQVLAEHEGDAAAAARSVGLVDGALSRRELREMLIERVGANADGDYNQIAFKDYLARTRKYMPADRDRVGIIVASGVMLDGEQPSGSVGGDTLARIIRDARDDDHVKAVVLRIDSGGGSAFAAEVIRNELQALKESGKPLVVSMGSAAASGGYWIAADADEIWATEATLTGSIGIFGALPTFEDSLDKIGISTDGIGTTDVAGALRLDRPLNPVIARALQSAIEHGYRQFLGIVASGRGMLMEQVEQVAEGRVWTGQDAVQLGLADKIGSLADAVESAVQLAGLQRYEVDWLRPPLSPLEEIFQQLIEGSAVRWPALGISLQPHFRPLMQQAQVVTRLNDPRGIYALCSGCLAP